MGSALDSDFGLALQAGKGLPVTNDADFDYTYFSEGTGINPMPIVLPLEQEIGSGPLIRDVAKVGVSSGGAISFVPRPSTIGLFLKGVLGTAVSTPGANFVTHTFKFADDPFDLPYFTLRRRVGALGGADVGTDVRVAQLQFEFAAANFLRANAQFLGASAPTYVEDTSSWEPDNYRDNTPPFLTCKGAFELPTGTSMRVLRGTVSVVNVMPLDEQFIVGSYAPDDIEVVSRAIVFDMQVKADADLYHKMMYDPAKSGTWQPEIMREAVLNLRMETAQEVDAGQPYSLAFQANGKSEASGEANLAWSVEPIALRGNRQVVMRVTGTVLADNSGAANGPFSVTLINGRDNYATPTP